MLVYSELINMGRFKGIMCEHSIIICYFAFPFVHPESNAFHP